MQLVSMRRPVKLDRLAHIPSTPPNFEQGDNLYANAKILYTEKNDVIHPAMAVLKQLQQMDVMTKDVFKLVEMITCATILSTNTGSRISDMALFKRLCSARESNWQLTKRMKFPSCIQLKELTGITLAGKRRVVYTNGR